jgi:hypothetical protein
MTNSLWFFTTAGTINFGSKPSILASFVVLTRTESDVEFREEVSSFDLKQMGYSNPFELTQDFNHPSKIRIYTKKKYELDKKVF